MQSHKEKKELFLIALGYSDGAHLEKETCFIQMGLLYLATMLKDKGYSTKVIFRDYPDVDLMIEEIKEQNPGILGFYTTTENIFRTLKCAKILKKAFPSIIIILGGPHGSIMDKEILGKEKAIDLIVRKEGEITLSEIVSFYFAGKGRLEDIKGITYRKEDEIIQNPDREFIEELDSLPIPDRDFLEEPIRTFDILYPRIITGRGCPFKCAFCYEGFGNKYRMRGPENVLEEVDYLLKRGTVRYIRFLDDTFTVNPGRTMKICKGLRERSEDGKKFVWFAEGRVDVLSRNPRLIYEMSLSGLANIQLGVECADEHILELYQKNITLAQIEKVVSICNDALIPSISINFILGGPFESHDIYEKNLNFIRKLMALAPGRLNITSSILVPFPGTAIRKEPEKFGLKIIDPEMITGMTNEACFCESESLNKYDLINMKRAFERDVENIMKGISKEVPYKTISQHFSLQFFGITSPWQYLFSEDTGIKRFFNLKLHSANLSFSEMAENKLADSYPTRTYPLNYNKQNLVIVEKVYGEEELDFPSSRLYELSSGKRTFRDIVALAKENIFRDMSHEEIHRRIRLSYENLEKLHAIIFTAI